MINKADINNFRSISALSIEDMPRVNLISGANNSGKTTFLEALAAGMSPTTSLDKGELTTLFRTKAHSQELNFENFTQWLFHDLDHSREIQVILETTHGRAGFCLAKKRNTSIDLDLSPQPLHFASNSSIYYNQVNASPKINTRYTLVSTNPTDPSDDAVDYNKVVRLRNGEERVDQMLRVIDPRLKKVRSLQTGSVPLLYADIGLDEMVPVTNLGQGFARLLSMYSKIIANQSSVCLIDEIENGLHHSVLPEVWQGIALAAEQENVQIFATTHSWECIKAAHACFSARKSYDFALHRLELVDREVQAVTYDQETLDAAIQAGLEVR